VLTSTPFSLASVSKSFIAVATMQAVEDGLVTLDTPVDDLVDFDLDNPKLDGETISLVHLATHTAGIRDTREYDRAYVMGDPEVGLGEFVEGYLVPGGEWYHDRSWRSWEPGDEASYSNVGAALAAHALEGATATPFEDLTHDQIFAPLGMEHTAWFLADLDEAEVAMPHEWSGGAYEPYGHYGFPTWPDGQLRSSVDDLSRYLAAIQAGGELDGVRILDQASVDEMLSDQAPEVMEGHGVFWYEQQREGRTTWGHSGGDFGVMTEMFFDREAGVGVVFMLHAIPPVFRAYEDYVLLYEDILAAAE